MRLILAEKPSVALDIARALGHPQKGNGFFTVNEDIVTWAYGHLVTLADPAAYDPAWKRWSWPTLPMLPEPFQLEPIAKTQSHLNRVLRLMRQADLIVCATDGDREGELIFRYIHTLAQTTKPVERLWLSENTPQAIRKAFHTLKPLSATDALAQAAQARAQADWLIGLNATRAFSLRHSQPGHPLSVGRVQTPTLRLIVDRDQAIRNFQPTPYWQLTVQFQADAGEYPGIWQAYSKPGSRSSSRGEGSLEEHPSRILTAEEAQNLAHKLTEGTPGRIDRHDVKTLSVPAPLLFNLNDLQKEANRKLGLTAQQSLDAAQSLYDQHLTSYPRTEARVITAEIAKTLPERLKNLEVGTPALRAQALSGLSQRIPRVVNDQAVTKAGHYAIIPTGQAAPGTLSHRDRQVFGLICRRFLAALLPPGHDEKTTIWTVAADEQFKTTGRVIQDIGWRAVYTSDTHPEDKDNPDDPDPDPDTALPSGLQAGDPVQVLETRIDAKETKPPARFTDATLLSLMEKFGLGTPATRSRIVEVLLTRGYVLRDKKALVSTERGRSLLDVLPEMLQSPDLTGNWETRLEKIAEDAEDALAFLEDIRQLTREVVTLAQGQTAHPADLSSGYGSCPLCHQGQIVETSKGWGCSRWKEGCRFMIWKTVAGKRLTATQVKILLAGKTTAVLKGFKSKSGKSFDARLKLEGETGHVAFVFDSRSPSDARHANSRKGGH